MYLCRVRKVANALDEMEASRKAAEAEISAIEWGIAEGTFEAERSEYIARVEVETRAAIERKVCIHATTCYPDYVTCVLTQYASKLEDLHASQAIALEAERNRGEHAVRQASVEAEARHGTAFQAHSTEVQRARDEAAARLAAVTARLEAVNKALTATRELAALKAAVRRLWAGLPASALLDAFEVRDLPSETRALAKAREYRRLQRRPMGPTPEGSVAGDRDPHSSATAEADATGIDDGTGAASYFVPAAPSSDNGGRRRGTRFGTRRRSTASAARSQSPSRRGSTASQISAAGMGVGSLQGKGHTNRSSSVGIVRPVSPLVGGGDASASSWLDDISASASAVGAGARRPSVVAFGRTTEVPMPDPKPEGPPAGIFSPPSVSARSAGNGVVSARAGRRSNAVSARLLRERKAFIVAVPLSEEQQRAQAEAARREAEAAARAQAAMEERQRQAAAAAAEAEARRRAATGEDLPPAVVVARRCINAFLGAALTVQPYDRNYLTVLTVAHKVCLKLLLDDSVLLALH